eukprot:7384796-Prymnesium_polylepis.1
MTMNFSSASDPVSSSPMQRGVPFRSSTHSEAPSPARNKLQRTSSKFNPSGAFGALEVESAAT